MTRDELILVAKATAIQHGLAPELVCAVCEHETGGWNPWAVRYEPAFEKRWDPTAGLTPTEHYGRAFSYGLMQIMGETARELGFLGQYQFGCRKLAHCMGLVGGNVSVALLKYNGGGDPGYPDEVTSLMMKYKSIDTPTGS